VGLTVLAAVLAVAATWKLLDSPGTTDVAVFTRWLANVDTRGLIDGYRANESTYPPVTSIIFFIAARVGRLLGIGGFMAIKWSLAVFLGLSVVLTWRWTRSAGVATIAWWALLLNSVALGYVDIYLVPSLILALWALRDGRLGWFTAFYAASCLTKWQPLIIAPFAIVYLLRDTTSATSRAADWKRALAATVVPGGLVFAVALGVFGLPVLDSLVKATSDSRLSGNALNLGWLATYVVETANPGLSGGLVNREVQCISVQSPIALVPQRAVMLGVYAYLLLAFARTSRTYRQFVYFGLLGYLAYFVLNTGVHENHLVPAMVLGLALAHLDAEHWPLSAAVILICNFNMFLFYGLHGRGFRRVLMMDVSVPIAMAIVMGFVWLLIARPVGHREWSR
jgi:hypothetical protein